MSITACTMGPGPWDEKVSFLTIIDAIRIKHPSKIEWDLTNGPLTKLLELLDTKV